MSRRRILPFYLFTDPYNKNISIKVQAFKWTHLNSHPHDGKIFRVVKPLLDRNGLTPKGNCRECSLPLKDHGLIPDKQKLSHLEDDYIICPGDWILLKHNEYWHCPEGLFEEIYRLLPKKEWYEN